MAFSRATGVAKAKAAPHDPAAEAWQQMLAKERAEQEAQENVQKSVIIAAEERRWKEAQDNHYANYQAASKQHAKMSEEQLRLARIERSKAEAAKRATAGLGKSEFSWKKQVSGGTGYVSGVSKPARSADTSDLPGHDDCELGISAMISRTVQGMREGLRQLGLPDFPLNFVPGKELSLCGHDVREIINEMIHMWMCEEKDEFYNILLRVKQIVEKPILTEEEVALVQQKEEWEKLRDPEGQSIYMQKQKTAQPASLGPPAKPKSAVSNADDSEDEVIDVSTTPLGSSAPNFAKPPPTAVENSFDGEDYYSLFGVPPTATLQQIRTTFRQLVATEHPEKGGDARKFAKLNKAYGILSDPVKRQQYDEQRIA